MDAKKKPLLIGVLRETNSLTGILSNKKPLLGEILPKQTLDGVLGYGIKTIEHGFTPYIEDTILYFENHGSVEESELILDGE